MAFVAGDDRDEGRRLAALRLDEQAAQQSRDALGTTAFETAFEAGKAFSLDQVIVYALEEKAPRQTPAAEEREKGPTLTRREHEISLLVAAGLTNKEIAVRLVIAQRTAETHVENILTKFGFSSRAQIAAWVAERRSR
jgi:DNA-binding NarL/FixJ family response regulator